MTVDTTLTFTSSDILVYKLSAVDMHGNEGPTCTAAPGIAGLPPEIGTGAIRLEAIVPNPAHGGCSFRLRLPAEAPVRLEVLDL